MNTIITKTYSLRNQPHIKLLGLLVVLIDSDHMARSFYQQKMQEAHLEVLPFVTYHDAVSAVNLSSCNALVFGLQPELMHQQVVFVKQCVRDFPQIPLITIAKTMQEKQIDAIMKSGSRLHINRDFSHPRDLIVALEQIL